MANISRKIVLPIRNEIPSGLVDGANNTFSILYSPLEGTVVLELNGLVQTPGSGRDYIISGNDIIFSKPPKVGNKILVNYYR